MISSVCIFLTVLVWAVVLIILAFNFGGIAKDYSLFQEVRHDNFEERLEYAGKQNKLFVCMMRKADNPECKSGVENASAVAEKLIDKDKSATETLLAEARDNLKNSYDLRSQENQTAFSLTAIVLGMVSALIYLSKQLMYMDNPGCFALYLSLSVLALSCVVVSIAFLLESFSLTYKISDSADEGIQNILQGKDCKGQESTDIKLQNVAFEVRYRLVAECAARSQVNSKSNCLKSDCLKASRKYMKVGGIFLLAMLITAGAFKVSISPSGDMLKQIFGCC